MAFVYVFTQTCSNANSSSDDFFYTSSSNIFALKTQLNLPTSVFRLNGSKTDREGSFSACAFTAAAESSRAAMFVAPVQRPEHAVTSRARLDACNLNHS